ncbi:3'-5' exonuclease [Actinomadura sp. NPDC023710]|uniref:3'-5' exonuclease n=1 Tax=Actinomadura sp. NPDC023710 TaxID=3158219 RepID=UPI0033C38A9A
MARLSIYSTFVHDLIRLPRPVQAKVEAVFDKFFEATHTGLHLEKVNNAQDPRMRTIRIDKFWRGVVLAPDKGDVYTLLKVLPHDDAYAWIQRRRASVNITDGQIELRDVVAIDATVPVLRRKVEKTGALLFAHVSDGELRKLGLDDQIIAFARVVSVEEQLEDNRSYLPPSQYDVLCGLAAGMTPEEVWIELGSPTPKRTFDESDIDAAVERPGVRIQLVDGPQELMRMFEDPFSLWRVYLHPAQYRVAHTRFAGAAQVTGGPGTGKTVVVLHRARDLAERGGRVLLTTFTTTLANALYDQLRLLVTDDVVLGRIEVRHVDQVAHRVVINAHGRPNVLSRDEERQLWRQVARRASVPRTEAFLSEEWRQVVLAQNITDLDGYLNADRAGRGKRLQQPQRAEIWKALSAFAEELATRRVWTHETICVEATRLLSDQPSKPYEHVLVDEAQDLHPVRWRLLRAAVTVGEDDVFLAADPHQRIYDNHVSLRSVGIDVTGRSSRLSVNYRTTAEILAWSLGLLTGEVVKDMDGQLSSLSGCRSEVHGRPPILADAATRQEELKLIAAKIRAWLEVGVEPSAIGVATRSHSAVSEIVGALTKEGIKATALGRGPAPDSHIQVATMHRMKGLEFRCLAVASVAAAQLPSAHAVTPVADDELTHHRDLQRERCLLFVACTRAREDLHVSWHGMPSAFLPANERPQHGMRSSLKLRSQR